MAIEIAVRVHPSPAVPAIPAAYLMIERVDHARLVGMLSLHIIVFASKDDRDRLGEALEEIARQSIIVGAGDQSLKMAIPASKNADEILAARAARQEAAEAYRSAQEALALAQAQAQAIQPIDALDVPRVVAVPSADVPFCLRNSQPDIALCYDWLASQSGFAGVKV